MEMSIQCPPESRAVQCRHEASKVDNSLATQEMNNLKGCITQLEDQLHPLATRLSPVLLASTRGESPCERDHCPEFQLGEELRGCANRVRTLLETVNDLHERLTL
jgi:hypothetical protein